MKRLPKAFLRKVIEEHAVETRYYAYLHHTTCYFDNEGYCAPFHVIERRKILGPCKTRETCDRLFLNEELEVVGYKEGC